MIDPAILRTLVAAAETGSFAKAAKRVGRSESAVSLQLKRLDATVGQPMFRRVGRAMALTEAGQTMLAYGRRILDLNAEAIAAAAGSAAQGSVTLGVPQDFAETWLPSVLARFGRSHPAVRIRTVVGRSTELASQVKSGELDLAIVFSSAKQPDAIWRVTLPMVWIGPQKFQRRRDDAVSLVVFDPPCAFRAAAAAALQSARVPWDVAFTSPSLGSLWSAVFAGLGVTVRTPAGLPSNLVQLGEKSGLPRLPKVGVSLLRGVSRHQSKPAQRLQTVLTETMKSMLGAAL